MESQLGLIEKSFNTRYSPWVREALEELPHNFTITDPTISGHPIVFASPGFLKMSGFRRDQVIGNNGRMFQGPKTNRKTVMEIREAIREERAVQVSLWNYRKDGTPFWMLFQMSPVFSKEDGRVIHFIGVQVPILRNKRSTDDGADAAWNEIVFGSCRREVCSDSLVELGRVVALDAYTKCRGVETEEPCEANDLEKQSAATAINSILSVLTLYSEPTGRLVCGKRCSSPAAGHINSSLNIALGRINQSFVLIDPHLPSMPIVYASDAFLKLTGYDRHEVLGCNWRFLSGVGTDSSVLNQIQQSIQAEQACTVCFLNYRKDNSTFWNLLHMSPVRNATGKMEEKCNSQDRRGLSPETRQLSAVGAVKVAVRSLSMGASCSKSSDRFNTL
ncbi:PREDICTED: protein TWIN LOV 1-like isoform X2 [Populus euphratica]|uniref:Protein TWIN LOV 1-like isoform X2 n=1 Tax=Populus euphratica TaxID=75702 RepID=A0AAJ6Y4L2_POPEU|nr:PREDICTED: protein TWIN LOV 1-like isoform X2 [Populus euphratica]